jgi:curved DNA-binding protein CbpA
LAYGDSLMARTLYDVLMISPHADRRFMSVAYRHLAKRYHPDVDPSPAAEARMAELNAAYAVLSDPEKRAAYDERLGLRLPGELRPRTAADLDRDKARHEGPDAGHGSASAPGWQGRVAPDGGEPAAREHPLETAYGEAGPPPVNPVPTGPLLTFGRYRGWTLNQVARFDRDYLEWLSRTTMGRTYRRELDALLRRG